MLRTAGKSCAAGRAAKQMGRTKLTIKVIKTILFNMRKLLSAQVYEPAA